jgi:glycerophosphoryl diester phosphodiesterase
MMLESLAQPIIFAHRGASAYAPENTLSAFELAVEQGADAIELDVKLSSDGHAIAMHDDTVDRTTGAPGRVKDMSLAELRWLDAGSIFSETFRGEKIPLLEEVFELVGRHIFINVELANYDNQNDHLVETVCMTIKKFNLQEQIMFSSFHAKNLKKARGLLPDVPRGLLATRDYRGVWMRSFPFAFGSYQALQPHLENTSLRQINRVHRMKRRVHVWTVNGEDDIRRLFRWGVDGVFTDDPLLALRVRGEKR